MPLMILGASGGAGTLTSHNHTAAGGDGGELTDSLFDGYLQGSEVSAPLTPPANSLRVYVKDKAGVSALYAKNDAGTEYEIGAAGGLVGHDLVGPDHTASGLTAGQVVRAATATTFAWAQLAHADLATVTANQHHNQAHAIDGGDHTGSLTHAALGSVTANQHHNQAHAIDGADHTASGLTAGHALRATGAATFAFGQVQHGDLGGVTANQHHNQAHAIDGGDHSGTLTHGALGSVTANQHHNQAHALWSTDHSDVDTGDTRNDGDVLTWVAGSSVWRATAPPSAGGLTVKEVDGAPSVAATTLRFPNGTLTDDGGGQVTYTAAAAGGGTGYIPLPIGAAVPPDGSSGNAAPAITRIQGTESNPKKHFLVAAFDPSTDEHLWWEVDIPGDYASGGTLRLWWMANSASGNNVVWGGRIGAVTAADADTPVEHAAAAASTTTAAANATEARRLIETTIALANLDSVAANDLASILIYRDADNASDTLAVDAELIRARFEYTKS